MSPEFFLFFVSFQILLSLPSRFSQNHSSCLVPLPVLIVIYLLFIMDSCFPQQQDNNVGVTRAIASHKCTPFDFSFKFKENNQKTYKK
jgi:hypothetical protein